MAGPLLPVFAYLWAGPNTFIAVWWAVLHAIVGIGFTPRNNQVRFRRVDGVLEVSNGLIAQHLRAMPTSGTVRKPAGAAALTLGHVVFGVDPAALDRTRRHERVHVSQYERWGPFFVPAYLFACAVAWRRGHHPYLDSRFEREAFAAEGHAVRTINRRPTPVVWGRRSAALIAALLLAALCWFAFSLATEAGNTPPPSFETWRWTVTAVVFCSLLPLMVVAEA